MKRVYALLGLLALAAGALGCTMTQKVARAVTGFAVGGPVGAGVGAVIGGAAVPIAMAN